jgi:hypothetical protein
VRHRSDRSPDGFAYSTSLLNPRALGDLAPEFERSLDERLRAFTSDGTFHQSLSYAYELARRDPGCVPFRAARAGAGPATRPPALGLPHR